MCATLKQPPGQKLSHYRLTVAGYQGEFHRQEYSSSTADSPAMGLTGAPPSWHFSPVLLQRFLQAHPREYRNGNTSGYVPKQPKSG